MGEEQISVGEYMTHALAAQIHTLVFLVDLISEHIQGIHR